jgi:hypothetical protein
MVRAGSSLREKLEARLGADEETIEGEVRDTDEHQSCPARNH